jgi:hypothetical protein
MSTDSPVVLAVNGLLDYCKDHDIFINSKIQPRTYPSKGLGVYASQSIANGERLIHVPTAALLTTRRIPLHFAPAALRKNIPVHALLAAYLAFGNDELHGSLARWMKTWPTLADFTSSIPMTWPDELYESRSDKKIGRHETSSFPLPPTLTGAYLPAGTVLSDITGSTILVLKQKEKLQAHIKAVEPVLEAAVYEELINPASVSYWRFVHSWLCVNSRCFSYTPPGVKAPSDPNEAMAMCPGMDLFNHSAASGVRTKSDRSGYFAHAERSHKEGEEILLNYGQHLNDVLWSEYGFLLDSIPDDTIRIDSIVLKGLKSSQKGLLEEQGYLGEYWLTAEGVCYRSQVVAWMTLLDRDKWQQMLLGHYDPEKRPLPSTAPKRLSNGDRKGKHDAGLAHRLLCAGWVKKVQSDAKEGLDRLRAMSDSEILQLLGSDVGSFQSQLRVDNVRVGKDVQETMRLRQARQRHAWCVKRWSQINDLCDSALQATSVR